MANEKFERIGVLSKKLPEFKTLKEDPINSQEELNAHAKGLAEAITLSYIFEEDDLHRGNMSKKGQRIDFDMTLWPITVKVKGERFVCTVERVRDEILYKLIKCPAKNPFSVNAKDILELPKIVIADPYYWPTTSRRISSTNCFTNKENDLFNKLKDNAEFKYHKFKILLKFILTDESIYTNIAKLHIRSDSQIEGKSAIGTITGHIAERIEQFKQVICGMSEYIDFIKEHMRSEPTILQEILSEFELYNKTIALEVGKSYAKIDLKKIEENWKNLLKLMMLDEKEFNPAPVTCRV